MIIIMQKLATNIAILEEKNSAIKKRYGRPISAVVKSLKITAPHLLYKLDKQYFSARPVFGNLEDNLKNMFIHIYYTVIYKHIDDISQQTQTSRKMLAKLAKIIEKQTNKLDVFNFTGLIKPQTYEDVSSVTLRVLNEHGRYILTGKWLQNGWTSFHQTVDKLANLAVNCALYLDDIKLKTLRSTILQYYREQMMVRLPEYKPNSDNNGNSENNITLFNPSKHIPTLPHSSSVARAK
jgi:hypothetical protein